MRRNTFSGLLYRDDPAVFGWNLINEPRSKADMMEGIHEIKGPTQYKEKSNVLLGRPPDP